MYFEINLWTGHVRISEIFSSILTFEILFLGILDSMTKMHKAAFDLGAKNTALEEESE